MATAKSLMEQIVQLRKEIEERAKQLSKDDLEFIKAYNEQWSRYEELRFLKDIRDGKLTVVKTDDGSPVKVAIL